MIATDESAAEYIRDSATVYRTDTTGAAVRYASERLTHLAYLVVCRALTVGRELGRRHRDTEADARALGQAAGRLVASLLELESAQYEEARAIRVPSCAGCSSPLSHDVVDGWHCERIGCGEGQAWLQSQVSERRRPALVVEDVDCPECGGAMVERRRKSDGHPFLGCAAFPDCRGARDGRVL